MPKDVAKPPSGSVFAYMTVRFCAPKSADITSGVDPSRFKVEVPGEGFVSWDPATPEIRKGNLGRDVRVPAGTCISGNVHYLIAGERHIEAILYTAPEGIYRWAS